MEKLGIDVIQLGAQLVNVTILIVILKKFLYKPVLSVLLKRQEAIETGLKLRDEMEQKIKKLEETQLELAGKAKARARQIEIEAVKAAKLEAEKILAEAKKSADKIRRQAKTDAAGEISAIREKLQAEVSSAAADLANQALTKLLPKDVRLKLTEAQIRKL